MITTVAGIIAEFNPLHAGHIRLTEEIRRALGVHTAVICCMSGDYVQRGDLAVVRRESRAKAAVMSGVDLVLELPFPWSISSAEGFAEGGVSLLLATGLTDTLVFGSESGNLSAIQQAASILLREDFSAALRRELSAGISFPAARQRALERLSCPELSATLSHPNDILGVEYCKALLRHRSTVTPMAVVRQGAGHGEPFIMPETVLPSAVSIRVLLRAGQSQAALARMAPAMQICFREEIQSGRAPVFYEPLERAVLTRLRSMNREDFRAFDDGNEGLYNRFYTAAQHSVSIRSVLEQVKTRRYPAARIRRMLLRIFLNLKTSQIPPEPLYLRPLAMNRTGQLLLSEMKRTASLPILTKPADVRKLSPACQELLTMEAKAADLYTLAYPDLSAAHCGTLWKQSPFILPADR